MQFGSGSTFYLLSVQLKTNAEDDAKGMMVGDPEAEMSRFCKLVTYIQEELNEDEFDNGSLTQNLIVKMKDGMAIVNPPYKKKLSDEEKA